MNITDATPDAVVQAINNARDSAVRSITNEAERLTREATATLEFLRTGPLSTRDLMNVADVVLVKELEISQYNSGRDRSISVNFSGSGTEMGRANLEEGSYRAFFFLVKKPTE